MFRLTNIQSLGPHRHIFSKRKVDIKRGTLKGYDTEQLFYIKRGKRVFLSTEEYFYKWIPLNNLS